MLLGRRTDVLATNRLARALLTDFDARPAKDRNYARWMFLTPQAHDLLADWDVQARAVVENLRLDAGRDPDDPATQALSASSPSPARRSPSGGKNTASISAPTVQELPPPDRR